MRQASAKLRMPALAWPRQVRPRCRYTFASDVLQEAPVTDPTQTQLCEEVQDFLSAMVLPYENPLSENLRLCRSAQQQNIHST